MIRNIDQWLADLKDKIQDEAEDRIDHLEETIRKKERDARMKEEQLLRELATARAELQKKESRLKRVSGKLTREEQKEFYHAKHCYNREFNTNLSTPEAAALAMKYFTHNWRKMNPKINLVIVDENGRPIDENKSND